MSTRAIPRSTVVIPGVGRLTGKQLLLIGAGLLLLVLIAIAIAAIRSQSATALATQPVTQQTLVQTVSASGTVNPQNTYSIGSQVSGNISAIYVDFNSKVKVGEVLAKIDPSIFQAQLDQAKAELAQAEAQEAAQQGSANAASAGITAASAGSAAQTAAITSATSTVSKEQSAVQLAATTVSRDKALLAQGYIAPSQMQTDQDALVQAQTALQAAQASLVQTRQLAGQSAANVLVSQGQSTQASNSTQADAAAVQSALANVQLAQSNVDHTIITSPINGTVINRAITVGQTVAAGLSAPLLFTIGQNLHQMEVDISVGEPDVGSIKAGQKVSFTVLAYPNDTFNGVVTQVRINPTTVNNVVTYDVVTLVDNSSGKLLPGMTATALIQTASAPNALVVPLAALQWTPTGGGHRHARSVATALPQATSNPSPWGQAGASSASVVAGATGTVFVQRPGRFGRNGLVPVPVHILLVNDGTQAAVAPVQSGALKVGDLVVTGTSNGNASSSQASPNRGAGGLGRML